MWGTLAEKISQRIGLGTTEDSYPKSRCKRSWTAKGASTKSIIQKRSVLQKPNRFSKWRNSKGALARVAITALHASTVMRRCNKIMWHILKKSIMRLEMLFQITSINIDSLGPKLIKWVWTPNKIVLSRNLFPISGPCLNSWCNSQQNLKIVAIISKHNQMNI